jgi:hypothetical protein
MQASRSEEANVLYTRRTLNWRIIANSVFLTLPFWKRALAFHEKAKSLVEPAFRFPPQKIGYPWGTKARDERSF